MCVASAGTCPNVGSTGSQIGLTIVDCTPVLQVPGVIVKLFQWTRSIRKYDSCSNPSRDFGGSRQRDKECRVFVAVSLSLLKGGETIWNTDYRCLFHVIKDKLVNGLYGFKSACARCDNLCTFRTNVGMVRRNIQCSNQIVSCILRTFSDGRLFNTASDQFLNGDLFLSVSTD